MIPLPDHFLHGSYSHPLVGLSILISIFASYAALDLAGRVTSARGLARGLWLGGGATAMGAGIWSMHYVGMLAFRLPVPVEYDWPTVVLSLLAAICASLIALIVVSQTTMGWVHAFFGSVFMGSGIASLHYIGMAAMRLPAMCRYSIPLVVTSIILAVAIALVALLLTFRFRNETRSGGWQKALCALVMGVAVPVMHYTGMAAASFSPAKMMDGDLSHSLSISSVGTAGIILVTFMILGLTILTSLVDRRFTAQTLELQATEKRSRQILETSFDAFVAMDARGRIIDWNQQAKSMLGWSAEEINRKCFPETIISDSYREAYNQEIERLLAPNHEGTLNERFESMAVHRDGHEIPVEITITAMRQAQPHNLAAFVRDVSRQKHAEENLQSFLKELEDLNFALDQHTIVARTDERGMITLANDNFCSISKYDRTELIGQDHRIINSGYHSKEFIRDLWATIKAGRVWKGEFKNRAKDGGEYWVATTIVPFKNVQGKIQQYISIRTDITPLKRAEEVSRNAQEAAEAASRAKSDFLANMSHEIRTPMNGIIGISDLLAQTNLDSEQRNYVGLVSNSAQSLLSVLNDILDFSKIESGKLDFSFVPVGLRQSLLSILKVFAMQASKKQIELTLLVSDDVPELIMADELRVRQVLNNLIGNALKFTSQGEIAVGVDLENKTDRAITLHFRVRDTGVGIPADKLKLIFEPFSQADSTITRKYGGTGLGLTISVRLIEMMHGRIWVESQPGVGSTFHFLASFEPAPLAAAAAEQRDPALLREKHALIVDDNATNRLILEKTLARWGMHTQSVESGAEGLAQLAAANQNGEPFSILIVDGQMPEMDGFTMVRQLRECPDFNPLTIVMLTSAGAVGDSERCRELGIRGFLAKPVDGETLHSAILRALGQTTDQPIRVSPDAESSAPPGIAYKILLAEDNPVNQVVATRHLEKLGHALKIAANGRRAVEMWEQDPFDLILMDVQMPEMSGYEATAEIRRREKQTRRHVPIIAMTAHAMVGDREKCLSAGMDGYVSKPIQIDTLAAEISNVLKGFLAAPPSPVPAPIVSTLNRGLLVTLMDGDLELLSTSVEICQGEFPRLLGELHAAADADDALQLERAGHALKGMLRGLAGEASAALAQKLEDMGRGSELSGSRAVLAELENEMHRFGRELLQLLEDAKGANSLASIS